jgi:hypothetical protein
MSKEENKEQKIQNRGRRGWYGTVYNNIKASKRFFYTYNKYKDVKIMIDLSYAIHYR